MSAIGGVRAFSPGRLAAGALHAMAETLQHRGPRDFATWVGQDVGLVQIRPAPVDLEPPEQPMHSVDGRWVLVLDGQIFNHETLRAHLDYPFRTRGSTEVVIAGLALEGISFVERLQGQFAFAAHDLRTETTHLVRDRLGILPLHYRHVPGGIAFGSEVRSLLSIGPAPQVDHRSLDAYLCSRAVPAPDTLFDGVKKVRPAHRVSIQAGGHLEETPYWMPPECDPVELWSAADAVEAVGDGVREAVEAALASDARVGAYLSGGLESSLVVAQMQSLREKDPVHTFSVGCGDRPRDEMLWARWVSGLLGTQHHEVQLGADEFEDEWSLLARQRDAPISEPTHIAVHALSRAARQHVPAVLSGEGGDELFAGATKYRYARAVEHSTLLPAKVRSGLGPVERRLGAHSRTGTVLRAMAAGGVAQQHDTWFASFTAPERQRLLGAPPPPERRSSPALGADAVDRMLRHDLRHWLPDHLLERGERTSLSSSVELRAPLLDDRLVELACRLPSSFKVRSGSTKWVLREAARPLLPDGVIDRRHSEDRVPLDSWFRTGLRDTVRDRLTGADSWVAQTLDRALVRDLVDRHECGANEEAGIWTLMCLEMWHESFFGAAPAVPRPRRGTTTTSPLSSGSNSP